jgi:hypothetical protein
MVPHLTFSQMARYCDYYRRRRTHFLGGLVYGAMPMLWSILLLRVLLLPQMLRQLLRLLRPAARPEAQVPR